MFASLAQMKLVNKQMASSMADLEAFSSSSAQKSAAIESKLKGESVRVRRAKRRTEGAGSGR